jgi:predicted lipoprotein
MMANMSAVQWGSVATWVAGFGTVAAVSFALWEARGERKERLRRELRQQAERISAWFVGMHKDLQAAKTHMQRIRVAKPGFLLSCVAGLPTLSFSIIRKTR